MNLRNLYDEVTIETRPFIDGQFQAATGGTIPKVSPIDGKPIPDLSACAEAEVDAAVACAQRAWSAGTWRFLPREEKKKRLLRLADLMEQEKPLLAYLDTLETGRACRNFLQDSIPKALQALRWFAEAVDKLQDHASRSSLHAHALMTRESLGVVGIITPWNDPLVVSMWKIAPALLMGNSVLVKPAEQSSYSILKIAELAQQAGIPDGVLNVLPGYGPVTGQAIALHSEIRGIFFTGSSEVGKLIVQAAGQSNMKKVGLECGGKSAFVVTEHCGDLQTAAKSLARSLFYNQGQICSAPSRAILHTRIADQFLVYLSEAMASFVPQDPWDINTQVGAVSSKAQFDQVNEYIRQGDAAGYVKLESQMPFPPYAGGFYIPPVVFCDVPPASVLAQEEIFGPVLVTHRYETLENAIGIANGTRFGLAAAVWSDHLDEALGCADQLQAGIVHINSYGEDDITVPFGGIKESGIGKDKSLLAFDDYSTLKATWIAMRGMSVNAS